MENRSAQIPQFQFKSHEVGNKHSRLKVKKEEQRTHGIQGAAVHSSPFTLQHVLH
jgi:hypothetical protein